MSCLNMSIDVMKTKELNKQYDYANGDVVAECVERDDYIVCYEK